MAKLYFYYAAMNAGKSTTLLQADFNYRERGMETMLWTAKLDERAGGGRLRSREAPAPGRGRAPGPDRLATRALRAGAQLRRERRFVRRDRRGAEEAQARLHPRRRG